MQNNSVGYSENQKYNLRTKIQSENKKSSDAPSNKAQTYAANSIILKGSIHWNAHTDI